MRRLLWIGPFLAYACVAAIGYVGFLVHESTRPAVLGYSLAYAACLGLLALVLALPFALPAVLRRVGARKVVFALTPLAILLVVGALAGSTYYATQVHEFDPFLQIPPAPLDLSGDPSSHQELRVLAVGGSTTRGDQLDVDDRYPSVLEGRLRESFPQAEVFNAGMDWWTTEHSLINYVTYVRRWQPDVVVVMHAVNDMYRSFSPPGYAIGAYSPRYSHFYGPSIRGAKPRSFLQRVFARTLGPLDQYWYARYRRREVDYPLSRYRSLDDFGYYLRTLIDVAEADGARVVLLTEGSLYRDDLSDVELETLWFAQSFCSASLGWGRIEYPSPASLAVAMEAFNDSVRVIGREAGIPVVDVASAIPRTLEYFVDDVHFTPRASKLVADLVAEAIGELQNDAALGPG